MSLIEKPLEDLSLVEIDTALAIYLNKYLVTVHQIGKEYCCKIAVDEKHNSFPFRPTVEYSDGSPIAEYYKVGSAWDADKNLWVAFCARDGKNYFTQHETMLAAQMLSILKAHLGTIIKVPPL